MKTRKFPLFYIMQVSFKGIKSYGKTKFLLITIISLIIFGCAPTEVSSLPKTQLQIREFQTRVYELKDPKIVMKSLLNVLQDEGFIVKNAVSDLGLIVAEKITDIENKTEAALLSFLFGYQARWRKASVIECTVNINEFGNQTKVRVNFVLKILDNAGGIVEVKQIEEPEYYQNFFSKVDKGIFLQKEKL